MFDTCSRLLAAISGSSFFKYLYLFLFVCPCITLLNVVAALSSVFTSFNAFLKIFCVAFSILSFFFVYLYYLLLLFVKFPACLYFFVYLSKIVFAASCFM